jgi:hypothetical protein
MCSLLFRLKTLENCFKFSAVVSAVVVSLIAIHLLCCASVIDMSQERRGGARPSAGRKSKVAYEAKALLAKDFKSLAQGVDVSDANLPAPQPWHMLQTATQAFEKADRKFAAAVVQMQNAQGHLGHVARNAEQAQHALRECIDRISELQELYSADPVTRQDEFLELDDLQKEKTTLEAKLIALAEQVAAAEDSVTSFMCSRMTFTANQTCCVC